MCARKTSAKKRFLFSDDFYSDLTVSDMLYARLVTSPFSRGVVSDIDFSSSQKLPPGYFLFTGRDLEKTRISILGTDIPVLCDGKISYKGEPLALLVGPDLEVLEELKKNISVNLESWSLTQAFSDFTRACKKLSVNPKSGELAIGITESEENPFAGFTSKIFSLDSGYYPHVTARRKICTGNVDETFSDPDKAHYVIEGSWQNKMPCKSNKETEGCLCYVKAGKLNIFTPCLWSSQLEACVTDFTGLPPEKIFITRTRITHKTTNSLWLNGIYVSLACVASIKTGKPVKFSLSRDEEERLFEFPPDIVISHKSGLDKNGLITAMDISIDFDSGAYNPFAGEILDRLVIASTGIYNCKNVRIKARSFSSFNPPSSLQLSMIDSAAFFAIENQIQKIAEKTGFFPVDIRQMNKAGGLQKITAPFVYSFGRSSDAINAVAIRSDFKRKYAVARLSQERHYENQAGSSFAPPLRGMGIACAFDGSAYLGEKFSKSGISMQVSVTEEKKIIVHAFPTSSSIREIWLQIISDSVDIDKRSVIFSNLPSEESAKTKKNLPLSIPESLVGTVSIRTLLLKKCMDAIKRKGLDGTAYTVKKSLSAARKKAWNAEEFSGSPFYNTSFGACTLELDFDACTFRENIKKISLVIDGGKILNPKAAEKSVASAVQRCLSMLVENEFLQCPVITVNFTQSEEEPKQIGRLVYSMLPAAYTSALSQALAVRVGELPLKCDSLYKLYEGISYENPYNA